MSRFHDWLDWLGGLPFEVASAPAVLAFYKQRRFRLENLGLSDGHGCNEFVFSRSGTMPPLPLRESGKVTTPCWRRRPMCGIAGHVAAADAGRPPRREGAGARDDDGAPPPRP